MNKIESLLYLSSGNLPSKFASTIQIAKMSQALAQIVENFELVTSGDIISAFKGMDSEFQSWYTLNSKFKLVRIPIRLKTKYPFPKNYGRKNYFKLAVLYAYLKSPTFVYTRTSQIIAPLLELGIPVLWERHELLPEKLPTDSVYQKIIDSKNLLGLITLSSHVAENYIKNGLNSEKVLIAHSGVDTNTYLPYRSKKTSREQLSLSQDANIVLYGGHLYEYKGITTILDTADKMPECRFVLVGGWRKDVERVKQICIERGLKNVDLVGYVPQTKLAVYLYAADVLLLPTSSKWELAETTSPMKLFDYMVVKRPIVASALPNIMTVLRDRENALLAQPDNCLSFKSAITEFLDHPSFANKIANQAFQEVDKYTWKTRAEVVLQFAEEKLADLSYCSNKKNQDLLKIFKYIL